MLESLGSSSTELTVEMLERAWKRLKSICPGCRGNGSYISESFEHYQARLLTAHVVRGGWTLGESIAHRTECSACGGTGQVKDPD